jgi:N-acetyl-anhydromuramyl-L-alanine amidase AmpD
MKIVKVDNFTDHLLTQSAKQMIIIHGTGGNSVDGAITWWKNDQQTAVTTPFVIDRDGTRYDLFDPHYDSYHCGVRKLNRISIGIEIVGWNQLKNIQGKFFTYTGKEIPAERVIKVLMFRGYEYFEKPTDAQIESLDITIDELCVEFGIPKIWKRDWILEPSKFKGLTTHSCVNGNKYDFPPDVALTHVSG